MHTAPTITLTAVPDVPQVRPGHDLALILIDAIKRADIGLRRQDVLVIAQKVVSKAQDRFVDLNEVTPSPRAHAFAKEVEKDPRLVEVILSESTAVLRHRPGLMICVHRNGFVMANAGVDQSNVGEDSDNRRVLLLPTDPDATCGQLKAVVDERFNTDVGVIINDSSGRPWRIGVVGIALGAAGLPSIRDLCGQQDLFGRPLMVTWSALADQLASAASLVMGEGDEGNPLVLIRGVTWSEPEVPAAAILRVKEQDLFR
ncbi:MAG: coenzyme F420-0:L-glutamate ligase [Gammaproteobacteria bacterium]|nr:coenzyme F420-0:L-glutamate ligase [Gammaproteobacteria bacterium]